MVSTPNVWKMYRALGLKEWGFIEEAYSLITEVIQEEVDYHVKEMETCKEPTDEYRYNDQY